MRFGELVVRRSWPRTRVALPKPELDEAACGMTSTRLLLESATNSSLVVGRYTAEGGAERVPALAGGVSTVLMLLALAKRLLLAKLACPMTPVASGENRLL